MLSSTDVLDWSQLRALRELQVDGEPDLVAQVITMFREDAASRLARARAAFERGDGKALAREGHSLRGSAGVIGASVLRNAAEALEREAGAQNLIAAGARLDAMARAIDDVLSALAEAPSL